MAKENQSAKAARQAAAEARNTAAAAEKARERKIRIFGGFAVVLVMGALIAVPVLQGKNKTATVTNATLPQGVTKDTYGVKVGPAWKAANANSIPKLQIWEDFQCPACGQMEQSSGAKILELADAGKIRLEWRPTVFIDDKMVSENQAAGNPQSSRRATIGFGCAVDAGVAEKYHAAVFASQPATEGDGYSNDTLLLAAKTAGLSGSAYDTFKSCFDKKTYDGWVTNSYNAFSAEGVSSTPTGILNGTELKGDTLFNPTALEAAVASATK